MSRLAAVDMVTIQFLCRLCSKRGSLGIPIQAYQKHLHGELIQHAWPNSTDTQREAFIQKAHEKCVDDFFNSLGDD